MKTFEVFFKDGNHKLYQATSARALLQFLWQTMKDEEIESFYQIREREE